MPSHSLRRTHARSRPRIGGIGRILVACYALLALAATGRSTVQILTNFSQAPLAYSLSALAAVVYLVATIALVAAGPIWYRVAWVTIWFELLFVLAVGTISLVDPFLFPRDTVWSYYGAGYLLVPLALPILGLVWLRQHRRPAEAATVRPASAE